MAYGGHVSESPPAFMCLFVPLSLCLFPVSVFDKHFLEAKSIPGLCSAKDTSLALEMLTVKLASSNISRWAEGPG